MTLPSQIHHPGMQGGALQAAPPAAALMPPPCSGLTAQHWGALQRAGHALRTSPKSCVWEAGGGWRWGSRSAATHASAAAPACQAAGEHVRREEES